MVLFEYHEIKLENRITYHTTSSESLSYHGLGQCSVTHDKWAGG